ncbi:hypothetical protein, partial [Ornithobacterium rhinotracheale]
MIGAVTAVSSLIGSVGGGNASGSSLGQFGGKIVGGVLSKITGGLDSVLANGFDLHCWGSSWSPSRAMKEGTTIVEWIIEQSGFTKVASADNFNKALLYLKVCASGFPWGKDCTRKGTEALAAMITEAYGRMLKEYQTRFTYVGDKEYPKGTDVNLNFPFRDTSRGDAVSKEVLRVPFFREKTDAERQADSQAGSSDYRPTKDQTLKTGMPTEGAYPAVTDGEVYGKATGHVGRNDNNILYLLLGGALIY